MSPARAEVGRFVFEAEDLFGTIAVDVNERRSGSQIHGGRIFLSPEAWSELREILLAPIRRPVAGASRERLTVPLVEHLRRKRA